MLDPASSSTQGVIRGRSRPRGWRTPPVDVGAFRHCVLSSCEAASHGRVVGANPRVGDEPLCCRLLRRGISPYFTLPAMSLELPALAQQWPSLLGRVEAEVRGTSRPRPGIRLDPVPELGRLRRTGSRSVDGSVCDLPRWLHSGGKTGSARADRSTIRSARHIVGVERDRPELHQTGTGDSAGTCKRQVSCRRRDCGLPRPGR